MDTAASAAPVINAVTGDDIVNGTEATAGFNVTGTGTAGDTITLTNGAGVQIGQAVTVDNTGNWSVAVVAADVTAMGQGPEQLSATATDLAGNISLPATKTISVDTAKPTAVDNEAVLDLDVTPSITPIPQTTPTPIGGLLNLGVLSDTIGVSLLSSSNSLIFIVPERATQQVTMDGTGSALLNLSLLGDVDFDLLVYRVENGSSDATLVYEKKDWLVGSGGILGASWNAAEQVLPEFEGGGTYYVTLGNTSGLLNVNLLGGLSINTVSNVITDYNSPDEVVGTVAGNVITDLGMGGTDMVAAGTVVSAVNGSTVIDGTEIVGSYGKLTINSDGSYSYTANPTFTGTYGDIDSFEYTITAPNGESASANLNITLDYNPDSGASSGRIVSVDSMAFSDLLSDDAASIDLPDTSLTVSKEGLNILSFDGSNQTISLSDIFEVEVIDLSGTGANTLTVKAADIANSGTFDPIYVKGNSDDTVDLGGVGADLSDTDGSGKAATWVNTQTTASDTEGQQYNVWALSTDSATQINIDVDITNVI